MARKLVRTDRLDADLVALGRIEKLFFRHDRAHAAIQRIHDFQKISLAAENAKLMLLYGESGSGKSRLVKRFKEQFYASNLAAEDEVPILHINVPSSCSRKALAIAMLHAFNDPLAERGTNHILTRRVATYIRKLNVSLVILDEFQHFIDRANSKVSYEAADWLKSLANEVSCAFLLVGTPMTRGVISRNEQLERRIISTFELEPFGYSTKASSEAFRTLVAMFAKEMPISNQGFLVEPTTAKALHTASKGLIGRVARLLIAAGYSAITEGDRKVTRSSLAKAYDELDFEDGYRPYNPFKSPPKTTGHVDPLSAKNGMGEGRQ